MSQRRKSVSGSHKSLGRAPRPLSPALRERGDRPGLQGWEDILNTVPPANFTDLGRLAPL